MNETKQTYFTNLISVSVCDILIWNSRADSRETDIPPEKMMIFCRNSSEFYREKHERKFNVENQCLR